MSCSKPQRRWIVDLPSGVARVAGYTVRFSFDPAGHQQISIDECARIDVEDQCLIAGEAMTAISAAMRDRRFTSMLYS